LFSKEEVSVFEPTEEIIQDDNHLLNDVKMIQLFYDPDNEKKFREIIDKVKEVNKIDNISDAVMFCVLNEGKNLK
jgi:intein/homing endonuclease